MHASESVDKHHRVEERKSLSPSVSNSDSLWALRFSLPAPSRFNSNKADQNHLLEKTTAKFLKSRWNYAQLCECPIGNTRIKVQKINKDRRSSFHCGCFWQNSRSRQMYAKCHRRPWPSWAAPDKQISNPHHPSSLNNGTVDNFLCSIMRSTKNMRCENPSALNYEANGHCARWT